MNSPLFSTPFPEDSHRDLLGEWNLTDSDHASESDDPLWATPSAVTGNLPLEPARNFDPPANAGSTLDLDLGLKIEREERPLAIDSLMNPQLAEPRPTAPFFGPEATGPLDAYPRSTRSAPKAGEVFHGFLILAELGRGAFARVFLAEQVDLGRRLVALKVGRAEGDEPQMLARLQHAHIMPIHSVYDDPIEATRLMCMPYLGGANLAQVLETASLHDPKLSAGKTLVDALDEVSRRLCSATTLSTAAISARVSRRTNRPSVNPSRQALADDAGPIVCEVMNAPTTSAEARWASVSKLRSVWERLSFRKPSTAKAVEVFDERDFDQPARQFLRVANTEQASVWVIARLAEGLEHAHSRGILHRDLKPSNILIAADGTPMLLDFNLSDDDSASGPQEGEKAKLGGTLPYMAPEHLTAFGSAGTGPMPVVDERSDIYALGLILFEMVAGEPAFDEPPPGQPLPEVIQFMTRQRLQTPPSLRASRPGTTWSVDSVVRKCLDPNPHKRYARARDLAEDLSRHLDDLPLKHAPEPSFRERAAKWTRRHPKLFSATPIATAAAVLIALAGVLVLMLASNTQTIAARLKLQVFRNDFTECQFLLNLASGPADHLSRGIAMAEKTIAAQKITPEGNLRRDSWIYRLTPPEQNEVREDTTELILQVARARTYLASRRGSEEDRRRALDWAIAWLDRAEKLDSTPPVALYSDRARYNSAMGEAERAAKDRKLAESKSPTTSRDFALIGTSLLSRGDLVHAESSLLRAIDLNPRAFWAWFALGHCHFGQGRYADAAGDFNACVALEPKFAWPHMNRGLALARAGRLREALDEYDHAVAVSPRFAEAWLNHALTDLELNDLEAADHAIAKAIALGVRDSGAQVIRAEIKARQGRSGEADALFSELLHENPDDSIILTARGFFRMEKDPAQSKADLEHALEIDPRNGRARYGLALLLRKDSPREALAQVDAALTADPNLLDALQLRALLRARLGDIAALDDAERLILIPTSYRLYNAACALALLVEKAHEDRLAGRALDLLDRALDAGFSAIDAATDRDLASLHALPGYQRVLTKSRKHVAS